MLKQNTRQFNNIDIWAGKHVDAGFISKMLQISCRKSYISILAEVIGYVVFFCLPVLYCVAKS